MVVYGWWQETDRGVAEPRIAAVVDPVGGRPRRFEFLVDPGADRTFVPRRCADELDLDLCAWDLVGDAFGVGSAGMPFYEGEADLLFLGRPGRKTVTASIGVFRDESVLDEPGLGRDILDLFAVVIDRRRDLVALLDETEHYRIGRSEH